MKKIFTLSFLSLLFVFTSCARLKPLINYTQNKIPEGLTLSEINTGIKRAAVDHGWIMKDAGKNKIEGTVVVRSHSLTVEIPYTKESYDINYKDSQNLNYMPEKNLIHRNYYRWIENLKQSINRELLKATVK